MFFFTTGDHFRYTICLTNGILLFNQEYSFDSENNYVEVKFSHILNIRVPRFTEKKSHLPKISVMGGGGVGLGTKATSHSVLCHLPFQWSGSRGDTFLVYSLTDANRFCQRFSFLSFSFSDPTTSSTPPL